MNIYPATIEPSNGFVGWNNTEYGTQTITLPTPADNLSQYNHIIWLLQYEITTDDPTAYVWLVRNGAMGYRDLRQIDSEGYIAILSSGYENPALWKASQPNQSWIAYPEYYGERTNYKGFKAYINNVSITPWRWGDVNNDSFTNNLDIDPFAGYLTSLDLPSDDGIPGMDAISFVQNDFNRDGQVNNLDIEGFQIALIHGAGVTPASLSVPESTSATLLLGGLILAGITLVATRVYARMKSAKSALDNRLTIA